MIVFVGVSNDLREETLSSQGQPLATFTSYFTSCTAADAFKQEISHFKPCENQKIQENAASDAFGKEKSHFNHSDNRKIQDRGTPRKRKRHRSSSRQLPFRKDVSQTIQLEGSRSKKGQPIVLDVDDDDDEAHIVEKTENQFPE
ncbi:hypothetical protein V8G54_004589 [Vigna mungo]|uniref:Uncharacterized protein n=1 Tax=Vigna mungo TaxID=3915 RepID=A0AAQ3PHL5_VIGMU